VPHDVSFVAVSRALLSILEAYRKRMGWDFKWVSSGSGDFNYDFHVSFAKDDLPRARVLYNCAMIDTSIAAWCWQSGRGRLLKSRYPQARGLWSLRP
jgi:predicted dithiol-disulfide oxidoreductase (DUF899 family)